MRRLGAALVLAAALAAGCGGADERGTPAPTAAEPAPAAAEPAAETGPTEEQLAVRKQLLGEIASGEYKCYCNAAMRARERVERGLVKPPPAGEPASAEP